MSAIFYVLRAGCAWSLLPKDFPPRFRDGIVRLTAADPLSTDIGRLRAGEQLPQRIRHPNAREDA